MKKFKKYWFYLLLALSISLTILVINDINSSLIPQIVQDINSGVIGAILTTIITLLLLSNQTESQENLTKVSVVYEEKLKIFNNFLQTLVECLEDGSLTVSETTKIIHNFSVLRIHISSINALKIENCLASIDNSFFYYDENSLPNLSKLIDIYTIISNVFREELYGINTQSNLASFDFDNLKKVLYRSRVSILKPNTFNDLVNELNSHSKILHTSDKTGITIVYDIDTELVNALIKLDIFMRDIILNISKEIEFTFQTNTQIINNEKYCGIPWIKLHYKSNYFAFYGVTEIKKLWIGQMLPEKKQVASLEFYEVDSISKYNTQITNEFIKILHTIDAKGNPTNPM